MLIRNFAIVGALATVVAASAACTPNDVKGRVECSQDASGKVSCSYTPDTPPTVPPTTTPPTTTPPTTTPPVTSEPAPVDPEPTDPNAGKVAARLSVAPLTAGARADWTTDRTDITGWRIGRDGTDTSGTGAWSTELPATARSQTFGLLRSGATYRLTLVAHTAKGDLEPVTASVTPLNPAPVEPPAPVDPVPADPAATSAAAKFGWGAPLPQSDEFNYTGRPDGTKWDVAGECWTGHAGNGRRCASRSTVDGSKLVQTGLSNGDSAWLASKLNQRYGKWEARVRSSGSGAGNAYHPLLIIWPQSNRWPQDGEYDFLENGRPGEACAESFIHYPHNPGPTQQVFTRETNCGAPLTEWHNVAFEWTPDHVTGYIDGKQWFKHAGGANSVRQAIQNMPSGHLTIQLDNFYGSGMQPARYEVDWARMYR